MIGIDQRYVRGKEMVIEHTGLRPPLRFCGGGASCVVGGSVPVRSGEDSTLLGVPSCIRCALLASSASISASSLLIAGSISSPAVMAGLLSPMCNQLLYRYRLHSTVSYSSRAPTRAVGGRSVRGNRTVARGEKRR